MKPFKLIQQLIMMMAVLGLSGNVLAKDEIKHKPHVLASEQSGDFKQILSSTKQALSNGGFEIVGQYSPYADTTLIVVTNDKLKKNAAASTHGGFGAIQRVSVSQVGDQVQVAYTNPVYMAHVYRMKNDLSDVSAQLEKALGKVRDFGADGMTAEELKEYHYKIFMPYFDDPYELAEFKSHQAAVDAVEKGLAANRGGVSKVYRVDVPGKQETVFGVAMTQECSGDEYIMSRIDFGKTKSATHLPYEMMVTGNKVITLAVEFRIAQSFPELSMVGSNSFGSIMCAPGEIEEALKAVAKKGTS